MFATPGRLGRYKAHGPSQGVLWHLPTSRITNTWLATGEHACTHAGVLCMEGGKTTQPATLCTQDKRGISPDHHASNTERRQFPPQPRQITAQRPRLRPFARGTPLLGSRLSYFQDEVAALVGAGACRPTWALLIVLVVVVVMAFDARREGTFQCPESGIVELLTVQNDERCPQHERLPRGQRR